MTLPSLPPGIVAGERIEAAFIRRCRVCGEAMVVSSTGHFREHCGVRTTTEAIPRCMTCDEPLWQPENRHPDHHDWWCRECRVWDRAA